MGISSFGLLFALIIYFRKDIKKIFQDFFKKNRNRKKRKSYLLVYMIITCIVSFLAGWNFIDLIIRNNLFVDVFSLAIIIGTTGIVMVIIDNIIKKNKLKDESKIDAPCAIIIGSSELLASLPGVFHPAAAIIAGRLVGLDNKSAAKYAFITAIPLVCGIFMCALFSAIKDNYIFNHLDIVLISNIATLIGGLLLIMLAMHIFKKPKALEGFGYFRIVIGLVIAIVALLI